MFSFPCPGFRCRTGVKVKISTGSYPLHFQHEQKHLRTTFSTQICLNGNCNICGTDAKGIAFLEKKSNPIKFNALISLVVKLPEQNRIISDILKNRNNGIKPSIAKSCKMPTRRNQTGSRQNVFLVYLWPQ
jgi:hypothetical protein